ncbi:hypothetical protein SAMN05444422_104113 [Halobiforma haloterrestris]|uniref:DUF8106 domain-containing protein n=1 Tax=Natronobacterium haloterrestre TaxID=148448 RepID=A0A1I1G5V2_NATHA|nr:hypothetical protein [Halobiforma haloterrestris]SFC06965.1 hypothetical protein SAMN05444422_104113 [Halobiforma haloterrestris]
MTRSAPSTDDAAPSDRRKSVLFCWACAHASTIDGDWIRRSSDGVVEYVCPVCDTTIDERPGHERTDGGPRRPVPSR